MRGVAARSLAAVGGGAVMLALVVGASSFLVAAQAAPPGLASHRAVYDLKLARTSGKRGLQAVRGRILYDFSGNACDGYVLQFRQVSELDTGQGKVALSDLRASTWEAGDAKQFRFSSQNFVDERMAQSVDGKAERNGADVTVTLTKPTPKTFALAPEIVLPTEHMRRIVEATREGKTLLEFPVYDGSDNGEKIYDTLTVIGHEIGDEEPAPQDAAAKEASLAKLKRWPVTISYFDRAAKATGEQTPAYSLSFQVYENGVARALTLDYGDFAIAGEISQLEMRESRPCP